MKDASKRRKDDIEANEKGVDKRQAAMKGSKKLQKRTAIVKPLPTRKLIKSKSENNFEKEGGPSNQINKKQNIEPKRLSNSLERTTNVQRYKSPQRRQRKQLEVRCKNHYLEYY